MEIDHTLVDAHLEAIPGLGTFTARSLPGGDSQSLGWHPDGSLNFEFLVLGSLDEVSAHLFQALDVLRSQGDPDTMDGAFLSSGLGILVHRLQRKEAKNVKIKTIVKPRKLQVRLTMFFQVMSLLIEIWNVLNSRPQRYNE